MAISFDPNEMLIEADSLNRIINNKDVKILDSRWYLNDKRKGLNEFKKNHIPNAVFLISKSFQTISLTFLTCFLQQKNFN